MKKLVLFLFLGTMSSQVTGRVKKEKKTRKLKEFIVYCNRLSARRRHTFNDILTVWKILSLLCFSFQSLSSFSLLFSARNG